MPVDKRAFEAACDAMIARVEAATAALPMAAALTVQALGMARTPVKSGTMRRSWRSEPAPGLDVYAADVAPTTVYSRRIELGFMDMRDSLGRLYHQRPHAYVKPGRNEALPAILALARRRFGDAISI